MWRGGGLVPHRPGERACRAWGGAERSPRVGGWAGRGVPGTGQGEGDAVVRRGGRAKEEGSGLPGCGWPDTRGRCASRGGAGGVGTGAPDVSGVVVCCWGEETVTRVTAASGAAIGVCVRCLCSLSVCPAASVSVRLPCSSSPPLSFTRGCLERVSLSVKSCPVLVELQWGKLPQKGLFASFQRSTCCCSPGPCSGCYSMCGHISSFPGSGGSGASIQLLSSYQAVHSCSHALSTAICLQEHDGEARVNVGPFCH